MTHEPHIFRLNDASYTSFPDPELCSHPEGLLAWGGDLHPQRLLSAYALGIFPWYEPGSPILWWSPDPRLVFRPNEFHISRSLRKTFRQMDWALTLDRDFAAVVTACAEPRSDQPGTWITPAMHEAYLELHELGYAHSIEVWSDSALIGGVYGVALGHVFFAESKFHRQTNASKVALASLAQMLDACGFKLIDCQVANDHLISLGARFLPRVQFRNIIAQGLDLTNPHPMMRPGSWRPHTELLSLTDTH